MTRCDALIIGGGVAGASLAIALAGAGRSISLVERQAGAHDKVCGEFLSREACHYLKMAGVDVRAMGAAPVNVVRFAGREMVAEARLPFTAFSLSRRRLDEALLTRAAAAGAEVRRGDGVVSLDRDGRGWRVRLEGGAVLEADTVFLATGKHDLRGWKRPRGRQGDLVGFKLHWRLSPGEAASLEGCVELVMFEGGYAGIEPIEEGLANLCLLVRRRRLMALGGKWEALLKAIRKESPRLDRRLLGAVPIWPRPLAISSIPYGYVRRRADGLWRLGDQAAVIPSFAGAGMSIALHSAAVAARCYLTGGSAEKFQRRLAGDVARAVYIATLLSQMMVRRGGQAVLGLMARVLPGLLDGVVRCTRVPEQAMEGVARGYLIAEPAAPR